MGQTLVSPKDATAKFDVVRSDNKVAVVSREGALTVKDGSRTVVVPSGSSTELALGPSGGSALAQAATPKTVSANFISADRSLEHPFYGVVNGVEVTPATLPVCEDLLTCIRPSLSMLRPCCCPPKVPCH